MAMVSWIFGSVLLLFMLGVFVLGPKELPAYKHRLLALLNALLAGLFGFFLSGAVAAEITAQMGPGLKLVIDATAGMALFAIVLFWWFSKWAVIRVENEDGTPETDRTKRKVGRTIPGPPENREVSGERSIVVGGNTNGTTIVTGDNNQVGGTRFDQRGQQVHNQTNIAGDQHIHLPPAPVIFQPLHQLRPPNRTFVGREKEIETLLDGVENGGATISGLRGMGGIGKTELAMVVADKLKTRFADAQILLDMQGTSATPLSPEDAVARVIHAFHPEARLSETLAELQPMYLSVLTGKRVLILADNAKGVDQVRPLIPPANCCLLVTSRFRFELKDWVKVDVSVLPPEEAWKLLRELAPRLTKQEATDLAEGCGYLPLALCLAGGALRARPELVVQTYLGKLKVTGERLKQLDKHREWTEEERGIESSITLSYDLLPSDLQTVWRKLSVFPAGFDESAAAVVAEIETETMVERLGDLWTYSLVERDVALQGRYRLHDLVRDFAATKLSKEERVVVAWRHAKHFVEVLCRTNELYLEGGEKIVSGLTLFDLERTNIETGQMWVATHMEDDDTMSVLCNAYPDAGLYCLALREHPKEKRIPWLNAGIMAARRLKDRQSEGRHLGNLGLAYADMGDLPKAMELHNQSLSIAREVGNRSGEGVDLSNIGLTYAYMGETQKAIEFLEQGLDIAREVGDRRREGATLGNLGLAYVEKSEMRKAIELYEQGLDVVRELGDRRAEGTILGNLSGPYCELGDFHKAIGLCEQSLVIARELGDRRAEGTFLNNLGSVYRKLGEVFKAIDCHEKARVVAKDVGDRRGEWLALNNLGNAHAYLGKMDKVVSCYIQCLEIAREIGDKRREANTLNSLGNAYCSLGQTDKAIELFEQCVEVNHDVGDKLGEANAFWNVAVVHERLGIVAESMAKSALGLYEEVGDPNAGRVRMWLMRNGISE